MEAFLAAPSAAPQVSTPPQVAVQSFGAPDGRSSAVAADAAQPQATALGVGVFGGLAVGAVAGGRRARRRADRSGGVVLRALDQSSRYADLSLDEEKLIKNGKHVLVAYIMKPKAGYDYLATAAHFAAESSTGTNVNVCTTDDFTKSVDALVYYIDPENEEMKIAYPNMLFDRNIIDGRAMMCSVLTLSIGNNQGMGDVEYGKIYDIYFPPAYLRLFDGPSCNILDMWRILGRSMASGGLVVGTIIKPKLGLQPKPFGEACYAFWQGGDFIKNDEPQGNQVFCQMNECIPEVVKAMRACIKETGSSKLFSANITADDPAEMIARGKYCLSQFGPLGENCAFLVDGYVAGGTAVTVARRNFPKQFLHYHRAGHGSVTSPQTQRGYTAFVHTKLSRVIGASGIHVGTMSFGKMEGDASDKNIAFMLQDDEADGPYYHQEWQGMPQTTPIISGGMNALRLPAFFENLGHSNVILTAGGGAFGHKDGPKQGATSCRQGEEAWLMWKAGVYGDVSLSDGIVEYAKTHEEIKGAFLTFQKDADQIYPGWKEKLGYTGESSVQAATFDWQKKAAAAVFTGMRAPAGRAQGNVARQAKKSVEDLGEVKGKTVLIRCDLNVPLNGDLVITDETRITASIPTIKFLCDKGAKVLACSHLGRPKDGPEEKFSLKPVAKRMGELMGKDIKCAPDCKATDEVKAMVGAMAEGDVVILENTRFYKGETKNDAELAESMASLADLFVNDAFGTAHRAHSSTEGVTKFLSPSVSGFLLKKELDYLKGAIDEPKKPMCAIVGGAKVSTKIPVIESMLDKVDKLVIGGGMVFTFLKARGLSVGGSLVEEDMLELAKKLEEQAKAKGVELILPSDIACGDAFPADGKEVGFKVVPATEIPDGWLGLDNGPNATEEIKAALADCKTIIWNGPMGVFESSQFNKGTYDVAECIAELTEKNGAVSIIGGGDSVSAVNKSGLAPKMSHISTGGGASLELLEGKVLPGVAALDEA